MIRFFSWIHERYELWIKNEFFCHNFLKLLWDLRQTVPDGVGLSVKPFSLRLFLVISSLSTILDWNYFTYVIVSSTTYVATLLSAFWMSLDNITFQLGNFCLIKHFNLSNFWMITHAVDTQVLTASFVKT